MTSAARHQADFHSGLSGGSRFLLKFEPPEGAPASGSLLCLQPFLDEGTLARRVLVAQSRLMAEAGWTVWLPDLLGMGDSAGLAQEATWGSWQADLDFWAARVREATPEGLPMVLWGIRLGALFAMALGHRLPWPHHLLLWQPVASGASVLDPLRKLGNFRGAPDPRHPAPSESKFTDLAGYRLGTALVAAISDLSAPSAPAPDRTPGAMLLLNTQRVIRDAQSQPPALVKLAQGWRDAGWRTDIAAEAGEPFWSSMEPSRPQASFERTMAWLASIRAGAAASTTDSCLRLSAPTSTTGTKVGTTPAARTAEAAVSAEGLAGEIAPSCVEYPWTIQGSQGELLGLVSLPKAMPPSGIRHAVLIVAGQPQTRVGSHRMFVDLARRLAASGLAVLRFDVGGWGDSEGEARAFEASAEDIALATAWLQNSMPTWLRQHALRGGDVRAHEPAPPNLWLGGLCDGASACLFALPELARRRLAPAGVYLINPWVRSEESLAGAMIKTYYARRLFEPDLWRRLLTGKVPLQNLVGEPLRHIWRKLRASRPRPTATEALREQETPTSTEASAPGIPLPEQLLRLLSGSRARRLTVLAGTDLTAGETENLLSTDARWRKTLEKGRHEILRVPDADHSFSNPEQWMQVADWLSAQIQNEGNRPG